MSVPLFAYVNRSRWLHRALTAENRRRLAALRPVDSETVAVFAWEACHSYGRGSGGAAFMENPMNAVRGTSLCRKRWGHCLRCTLNRAVPLVIDFVAACPKDRKMLPVTFRWRDPVDDPVRLLANVCSLLDLYAVARPSAQMRNALLLPSMDGVHGDARDLHVHATLDAGVPAAAFESLVNTFPHLNLSVSVSPRRVSEGASAGSWLGYCVSQMDARILEHPAFDGSRHTRYRLWRRPAKTVVRSMPVATVARAREVVTIAVERDRERFWPNRPPQPPARR